MKKHIFFFKRLRSKNENFIVFYKYGDEDDFVDKLKELYYNRSLLEKKKEEVDAFVKEYSWEETAKKIIEQYFEELN